MSYIPDEILMSVEKPARYTGGELNAVVKNKEDVDVRFAFCFADSYEIGMSHLGMKLLYELLNSYPEFWCERVFAPWPDLEAKMRENGLKLFALESQEEISDFDFIGFTLQYELSYTSILNMLDFAGLPVYAKDRGEGAPLVIGGGPSCMNPEPIADFFDIFNLGDGEEMLPEILFKYRECKLKGMTKRETLEALSEIPGVYIPAFYEPVYDKAGDFVCLKPKKEYEGRVPETIKRRVLPELEGAFMMKKQVVPYVEAIHDRIMLEIFRGCVRGCRFCQAGYIYRPARERSPDSLLEAAKSLSETTGYEEISLLSLATDDYTCLKELTDGLIDYTSRRHMNISLPSLRIDSFSLDLMEKISKVRKSGLTFALEAGTQRLRDVINKGISEEDLFRSAKLAFENGYYGVKLYFMIGLPTETDEDVLAIAATARKVRDLYYELSEGRKVKAPQITVSVSTFVPKAFTPFQWTKQISYTEIKRKLRMIKDALGPKYGFSWQDPELSVVENILARADRRASQLLYNVWKRTGGFDSWSEFFNYDVWLEEKERLGKVGIEGFDVAEGGFPDAPVSEEARADYLEKISRPLPWDFVDIGVTKNFMKREFMMALSCEITPDCRTKCAGCGCAVYGGGVCVAGR